MFVRPNWHKGPVKAHKVCMGLSGKASNTLPMFRSPMSTVLDQVDLEFTVAYWRAVETVVDQSSKLPVLSKAVSHPRTGRFTTLAFMVSQVTVAERNGRTGGTGGAKEEQSRKGEEKETRKGKSRTKVEEIEKVEKVENVRPTANTSAHKIPVTFRTKIRHREGTRRNGKGHVKVLQSMVVPPFHFEDQNVDVHHPCNLCRDQLRGRVA